MHERKINLDEILNNILEVSKTDSLTSVSKDSILNAMKEACRQLLELAAENAKYITIGDDTIKDIEIDKQSILDTIKQIE